MKGGNSSFDVEKQMLEKLNDLNGAVQLCAIPSAKTDAGGPITLSPVES
jgi:hypothetical protein